MGFIFHHAVVVTGCDCSNINKENYIELAREKAVELCGELCSVTLLTEQAINGYQSFLVAPDGSKEGWDDSNRGNELRAKYCQWLAKFGWVDWVLVGYGEAPAYVVLDGQGD